MTPSWIDSAFEALPFGLILLDREGTVLLSNAAASVGPFAGARLEKKNLFADFPGLPGLEVARSRFESGLRKGGVDLLVGDAGFRVRIVSLPAAAGEVRAAAFVESVSAEDRLLGVEAEHATLRRLVAETRHEINNPLMGLMGQLELLQMRSELPGWAREKIDAAMREAERIRDRVKQLRSPR